MSPDEGTVLIVGGGHQVDAVTDLLGPEFRTLQPRVERALLGSEMHELGGLEPTDVDVARIQHRLIMHLYRIVIDRIGTGQRDQDSTRNAVFFMNSVIYERLVGILEGTLEFRSQELNHAEKVPTGWFNKRSSSDVTVHREAKERLEKIINDICNNNRGMIKALEDSFLDGDVDDPIMKLLEICRLLQSMDIVMRQISLTGCTLQDISAIRSNMNIVNGLSRELRELADGIDNGVVNFCDQVLLISELGDDATTDDIPLVKNTYEQLNRLRSNLYSKVFVDIHRCQKKRLGEYMSSL